MTRTTTIPRDPTHWHQMRAAVLTSTDISTLFGYNRYQTLEQMWVLKKAGQVSQRKDTPEMKRGRDREPLIAIATAKEKHWNVAPMPEFIAIPELRLGSSFDWKRIHSWGESPFEIKTASPFVVARGYWTIQGTSLAYAGPRVELQLEMEMLVSGAPCLDIALETTDGRRFTGYREPRALTQRQIVDKAGEWWKAFDKDVPLPGMKITKRHLKLVAA